MRRIRGMEVANKMNARMQEELQSWDGPVPKLAIVRVGERPDDLAYERGACKRMEKIGLRCEVSVFPETITAEDFAKSFAQINADPDVNGILLLRPLPKHLKEERIITQIDPAKDLDGISPVNMAKLYQGDPTGFAPCTAEAVVEILKYAEIDLTGKNVAIIGRSLVIGKPLAQLMLQENATVTTVHTRTRNPQEICKRADIVVAAAGKARMVDASYIGQDAIVLDVGINYDEKEQKLCGDVDLESLEGIASMGTPVPGGVGSVTTSVLASHLMRAAKQQKTKRNLE